MADSQQIPTDDELAVPQRADGKVETELNQPISSSEWDAPTKRAVIFLLLLTLSIIFWISRPIMPAMIVSGIIAYLLSPVVDLGERVRIPRSISTILLFALMLVSVILVPVILIPVLVRQLISLSTFDAQSTARFLLDWFNERYNGLPETWSVLGAEIPIGESLAQLEQNYQEFDLIPSVSEILTYIQQLVGTATSVVSSTAIIGINVVGGIFQVIFAILIVFFLSLYMTKDAPLIRAYLAGLFPVSYQSEVADLIRRMGFIWQAFFRGQILLSLIVGTVTWGALTAVGMPGALILGILAGMMEVVPNLGPTLAMIPAVIAALIQGSDVLGPMGINNFGFSMIIVAIYFVIQQLENNILVPRIIGDSVNLHPIVVISGVAVGFQVFGILGALLAAPAIASLRVLGSYIHAKLLGYRPFVDQPMPPLRRRRFRYRRTVQGEERSAAPPLETPVLATASLGAEEKDRAETDTQSSDPASSDSASAGPSAGSGAIRSTSA